MYKTFFKYVLQSIAGMLGLSVYILADTFFISVCSGSDGLAVLNLMLPVYGVLFAIGSMVGIGSATRYGISHAKEEKTDHYFFQSVTWSVLLSLPFVLGGLFYPEAILRLLGADAGLTELGRPYLRIILIAAPFFMSNYSFTAFARNDNAPSIAMIASLAGSSFNILFDYIFMFPLKMGFPGAALATALSPVVTICVCSTHYFGKNCQVRFRSCRLSFRHLLSCCSLGFSAFVGEMSSAVITVVFNTLILGITGNIGVAAYGVIANLSAVAMAIFNGLAQGTQPLISENYGRGNTAQVKQLLRLAVVVCLGIEALLLAGSWGMTDSLIAIFNSEQNASLLAYAHTGLRLYFLGFLFAGLNILLIACFSAMDRARPAIAGSLLRGAAAIVPASIVLTHLLGINGTWLSFLASEVITFAVILILSLKTPLR